MGFRGHYRNKRDYNEPQIVDAFKRMGCSVERMDTPLDLLVGYRGRSYLVEVKQEGKHLNAKQRLWCEAWRGGYVVVRSVADVMETLREWGAPVDGQTIPLRGQIGG